MHIGVGGKGGVLYMDCETFCCKDSIGLDYRGGVFRGFGCLDIQVHIWSGEYRY